MKTLTTTQKTYQALLSYQVPSNCLRTVLEELSVTADANAQYRVIIGNEKSEQFRDETLPAATSWPWRHDNELFSPDRVVVYIRSPTGVSITVSATLAGVEEYREYQSEPIQVQGSQTESET